MSEKGQQAIAQFTLDTDNDDFENKIQSILQRYHRYFGYKEIDTLLFRMYGIWDNTIVDELCLDEGEDSTAYIERVIDNFEFGYVEEDNDGTLIKIKEEPLIVASTGSAQVLRQVQQP
jgi:hypothetical protein